jgi:hypothetical protein
MGSFGTITDLGINGVLTTGIQASIQRCHTDSIIVSSIDTHVADCYITKRLGTYSIYIANGAQGFFQRCQVREGTNVVRMETSSAFGPELVFDGCDIGRGDQDTIFVDNTGGTGNAQLRISNCILSADTASSITSTHAVLRVSGGDPAAPNLRVIVNGSSFVGSQISSADVVYGVVLENTEYVTISDCEFYQFREEAIFLDGTVNCLIVDNRVLQAGLAGGVDAVRLVDSSYNQVRGNMILPDSAGNTRYGINVSNSGCDCNVVVGNSLGDPADYGTDALNDAGTGTWLTFPNDPAYGDNFVDCNPTS